MLFNSYSFIIFFIGVLIGYFWLCKLTLPRIASLFLFAASLFFYGYWNPIYLLLIIVSLLTNYTLGFLLIKNKSTSKKTLLLLGIGFNVSLLAYFKYSDFFITNVNALTNSSIALLKVVLPLGISFFTFTQIAFLVDAYHNKIKVINFLNYGLFVTFFPHLLAGPIVNHAEMMPQFSEAANKRLNYQNLIIGIMIFAIGLVKKAYISDKLGEFVNLGYARVDFLSTLEAWILSFCYTFQLYFDFSGYTDMAIGCSLMLNIRLPENFNSPYKALNIQDFWRRWHMTLSRWLRNYIYIPLGGNQQNEWVTHRNLILTFLIGGFWHGAGWTYVVWGLLHGIGISIHRLWKQTHFQLPTWSAWLLTFLFVNFAWVFFRAESLSQAFHIIKMMLWPKMSSLPSHFVNTNFTANLTSNQLELLVYLAVFSLICLTTKNSIELKSAYTGTLKWNTIIAIALAFGILSLMRVTTFIYFQF